MCYGIFGNSGPSPADDSGMGDAVYGRGNSGNSMEGQVLGLLLMQRGALKGGIARRCCLWLCGRVL